MVVVQRALLCRQRKIKQHKQSTKLVPRAITYRDKSKMQVSRRAGQSTWSREQDYSLSEGLTRRSFPCLPPRRRITRADPHILGVIMESCFKHKYDSKRFKARRAQERGGFHFRQWAAGDFSRAFEYISRYFAARRVASCERKLVSPLSI